MRKIYQKDSDQETKTNVNKKKKQQKRDKSNKKFQEKKDNNKKYVNKNAITLFLHGLQDKSFQSIYLTQNLKKVQKQFEFGSVSILIGLQGMGKLTCVKYLAKKNKYHLILIDGSLQNTEYKFVVQLLKQLQQLEGYRIQTSGRQMRIGQLSKILPKIKNKIILCIRNGQKYNQRISKQSMMYSLSEWIRQGKIVNEIKIMMMIQKCEFIQNLQKRVKSRLDTKYYYFVRNNPQDIIHVVKTKLFMYADHSYRALLEAAIDQQPILRLVNDSLAFANSFSWHIALFKLSFALLNTQQPFTNNNYFKSFQQAYQLMDLKTYRYNYLRGNVSQQICLILNGQYWVDGKDKLSLKQIKETFNQVKLQHNASILNYDDQILIGAIQSLQKMNIIKVCQNEQKQFVQRQIFSNLFIDEFCQIKKSLNGHPQIFEKLFNY